MQIIAVAGAAVVGLVVGSFLNVVIWRVPRGESVVRPPSYCPSCEARVLPRDNVPLVSWVLLHGRCRSCGAGITVRYPLVEFGCSVLFAAMTVRFGFDAVLPAFLYLAAVGLALALIDLDVHRLPNALTLPSYVVASVGLSVGAVAHHEPVRLVHALVGMAAMYCFYFLLMLLKPGGMGFGDVKLAGVLGLYLGYIGWGALAVGAFLAFALGGVAGVGLMLAGRAGRKSKIPFGPYMIAGALIAVFVGQALAHYYVRITVG
jgi:leader peptidase (prepilin peptidase) / N-methyltransferase